MNLISRAQSPEVKYEPGICRMPKVAFNANSYIDRQKATWQLLSKIHRTDCTVFITWRKSDRDKAYLFVQIHGSNSRMESSVAWGPWQGYLQTRCTARLCSSRLLRFRDLRESRTALQIL